jgi:hypothetical protein
MPPSTLHKRKLKTNLAILALIFGFCALIAGITMIRIADGIELGRAQKAAELEADKPLGATPALR